MKVPNILKISDMKTVIHICGFYSLGLALFHMGFWKIFKWKDDLKKLAFVEMG